MPMYKDGYLIDYYWEEDVPALYTLLPYDNDTKNQTVEIIKLNGSIELAPIVGLAEVIVDIVETGSTLKENGLKVLEEVCPLSARVVVNPVSMRMENERITKLLSEMNKALKESS